VVKYGELEIAFAFSRSLSHCLKDGSSFRGSLAGLGCYLIAGHTSYPNAKIQCDKSLCAGRRCDCDSERYLANCTCRVGLRLLELDSVQPERGSRFGRWSRALLQVAE
jgi:hypothetical protein